MPALQLTTPEKTALDLSDATLEQLFIAGAEYPPGSVVIPPMPGYDNPVTVPYKEQIKAAFRSTLIAMIRSGAGKAGNIPLNFSVTGTTEQSLGAIYLETGTIDVIRAYLGSQNPLHAAILRMYHVDNGALIATIGAVAGGMAIRSVTGVVIPATGMYEFYLKSDTVGGVATIRNLSWRN